MSITERKPFNLTEALAGKPVIIVSPASEDDVQSLYHIPDATFRKVLVVVDGGTYQFTEEGIGLGETLGLRLYMKAEKRTAWINTWRNETTGALYATAHATELGARVERTTSCSGQKKVLLTCTSFEYLT